MSTKTCDQIPGSVFRLCRVVRPAREKKDSTSDRLTGTVSKCSQTLSPRTHAVNYADTCSELHSSLIYGGTQGQTFMEQETMYDRSSKGGVDFVSVANVEKAEATFTGSVPSTGAG